MSSPGFLRRQRRRIALAAVLCALLCGVAVTLSADRPGFAAQHTLAVPPPPQSPMKALATTVQHPQRRNIVREVDRQDWHQLDGDVLLPAHHGDNPDVLTARKQARLRTVTQEMAQAPASIAVLAEPRRPLSASEVYRVVKVHDRTPLQAIASLQPQQQQQAASHPPAHVERKTDALQPLTAPVQGEDKAKIALQSLRLVVRLTEDQDEEEDDDEQGKSVPHKHRHLRRGRDSQGEPSTLLAHPRGGLRALPPLQHARVAHDADVDEVPPRAQEGRVVVIAANRFVDARVSPQDTTHVYSDEELRQRCVVANGRVNDPAVLRAMMEGRLRQDCLVVAADVGNDIPTNENNAKAAVAIASVFVTTLFLVFALIF